MVGCDSLKVVILVRIQVPQPTKNRPAKDYLLRGDFCVKYQSSQFKTLIILMEKKPLREFFEKYVYGTVEKAKVSDAKLHVCNLTNTVALELGLETDKTYKVYITARALKHLYDKKPAEEFSCLLDGLDDVARHPIHVYKNREGKRAEYCLVGKYEEIEYICAIEILAVNLPITNEFETETQKIAIELQIATGFRIRDEKYLNKCTLLWSRRDGNPPS